MVVNHYEILNINKNDSIKIIRKKYYRYAKLYHPDKNKNKESIEKFKLISESYSILSNPRKRYLYDLKLKIGETFGEDCILIFSDEELELLDSYYNRLVNNTEYKFFKLLFKSLPYHIQWKIKKKFNIKVKSKSLFDIKNVKYIDARGLSESYNINLLRNFKDIYNNECKEIVVIGDINSYFLFISYSDYDISIQLNKNIFLKLTIETKCENFMINGNDLIISKNINLYEYYFDTITITTDEITLSITEKNLKEPIQIKNKGIKTVNNCIRGDIYIYLELNLNVKNIDNYKSTIKEIFDK